MRMLSLTGFAAGLLVSVLAAPAHAAPQIIALLPNDAGVPFNCADGVCQAELSSYCLQRSRPTPRRGTPYHAVATEDFELIVRTAGSQKVLPVTDELRFVAKREFMAMSATIDRRRLQTLIGDVPGEISLRVRPGATLLPETVGFDPNPLTEKEIAYVSKWRRQQAEDIVDKAPGARTVRTLAQFLNLLPTKGTPDDTVIASTWKGAMDEEFGSESGISSAARAQAAFQFCESSGTRYSYIGLRRCIEYRHDDLIRDLNIEYWEAKPGS